MATDEAESPLDRVETALSLALNTDEFGAFWCLDPKGARKQAAEQLSTNGGEFLPLAGEPLAVKDLLDVKGLPTTAGLLGDYASARVDAEAVRRLRSIGAIPIGKTAMDPLGCTTSGQASGFPPCLNPVDRRWSPGGSSSGSAVAVAIGVTSLALGTDTAGSVRIPAAYTGIVGFKPARTVIPRQGCVRAMPGFDTIGLLARSVAMCEIAYGALTRFVRDTRRFADGARGMRIGVLTDLLEDAEGPVGTRCEAVLRKLERSGARLEPIEFGWRANGVGVALAWELASNWGQRVDAEPGRYPEIIRDTIAFGRSRGRSSHDSAVAEIKRARVRLRRRCASMSAVVCPTVPIPAPDLELESTEVSTRFTRIFNALGWPAFSLPAGADREGRPIGIQAAAPPASISELVEVARQIEQSAGSSAGVPGAQRP